jgi:hypothetical protein
VPFLLYLNQGKKTDACTQEKNLEEQKKQAQVSRRAGETPMEQMSSLW